MKTPVKLSENDREALVLLCEIMVKLQSFRNYRPADDMIDLCDLYDFEAIRDVLRVEARAV